MKTRECRYQAAIVRDGHLLLIQHRDHTDGRTYWVVPGGGIESGETEEECVAREALEETNLKVEVVKFLFGQLAEADSIYERRKTYLCTAPSGDPAPGYEPELEASSRYSIHAVGWFQLDAPHIWDSSVHEDHVTGPTVSRIRTLLGYA